jgi:hypothetical protein
MRLFQFFLLIKISRRGSGEKNAPPFLASGALIRFVGGGWLYNPCFRLADGEPAGLRGGGGDAGCCRSHQNMGALSPNQVCATLSGAHRAFIAAAATSSFT